MKTFAAILSFAFVFASCEKRMDAQIAKPLTEEKVLTQEITFKNLDVATKNEILTTIERDGKNRVLTFKYEGLSKKYGKDAFTKILHELTNSETLVIHQIGDASGVIHKTNLYETSSNAIDGEVVGDPAGPQPHVYVDKKNYHRPGCKLKSGYICILYF